MLLMHMVQTLGGSCPEFLEETLDHGERRIVLILTGFPMDPTFHRELIRSRPYPEDAIQDVATDAMQVLRAHFAAYLSTTCYRDFPGFDPGSSSAPVQLGAQGLSGFSISRVLECSSDAIRLASSMKMISDGMVFRSFAADFTNMWSEARYWYYMFLASDQHRAVLQEHVDHLQQPGGAFNPLVVEEEEAKELEMEQEEPEAAEEVENPDVSAPPASPHHLAPNAPAVPPEFEQPEPHVGTPELAPLPLSLLLDHLYSQHHTFSRLLNRYNSSMLDHIGPA
jgi:hypothetical protein